MSDLVPTPRRPLPWALRLLPCLLALGALLQGPLALAADVAGEAPVRPRTRIASAIDDNDRVTLSGNRHRKLAGALDQGRADDALPVRRMILSLNGDAAQQAALARLVASRRDPASPAHGQWLSTAEFEREFGVSDADIATVVQWLTKQGFTVDEIPAGRRAIVFSGTAGRIRAAFQTEMHHYKVGKNEHLANATDPSIPQALSDVVGGVVSLHDFRSRPLHTSARPAPAFTSGTSHSMAAADFHTIYNIKPLLSSGIDGTGRSIAVLGRTNVVMADMAQFRTVMGLPANPPQIIINGSDPGRQTGDEGESDLDLQWAGAVAPGATIKFVTSASTASTDGIDLSAQYAVSNNVADVITLSYGLCEADLGVSATNFYNNLWQQATAQGMTVFVSSGDSGAADCDAGDATTATRGRGVNGLCTSPYSTCVGGTQFNDTANPAQYWAASNNATDMSSVLSYIPEVVWNESGSVSGGSGLWSSGGGASTVFAKPSWQTGLGVPNDGKRDVPDVALAAASHDGYIVYSSDNTTSTRTKYVFGGTSASAPSFAGIMALVNQKTGARQGNANPRFYQLAAMQSGGGLPYFHQVVGGNNSVPGVTGFAATTNAGTPYYNQATGLGSVDAQVLVNNWAALLPESTTTLVVSPVSPSTYTQSVTLTATVASAGSATPTGTVQFKDGSVNLGSPVAISSGAANLSTATLVPGNHSLAAVYSGDGATQASASASAPFDVAPFVSAVSLSSANASTTFGQNVALTASITGKSVGGTLRFMDGATELGTVTILSCPTVFNVATLGVGVHQITVIYSGDANNAPSTSAALAQTVNAVTTATSTSVSASASSVLVGQSLSLSVTVAGTTPGNTPTGTVQIMDGTAPLGSPVALNAGVASLSTNGLSVGSHAITVVYSGDTFNAPSVSSSVAIAVAQASSAVTLQSSAPSAAVGQSVSLTALVSGVSPTGSVQFMDGNTSLGVVAVNAGSASLVISSLSAGVHNVTALYSGDASNLASVSAAFVQTVVQATAEPGDADVPTLPPWAAALTGLLLMGMLARQRSA